MGGWGVNCSGLKANPPIPCISRMQVQEFSGWGFSGGNRRQAGRERSHSIQSQVLIYHSPCSRLCAGHWGYNYEEIWPLPLQSLSPTGKTERTNDHSINMPSVAKTFTVLWTMWRLGLTSYLGPRKVLLRVVFKLRWKSGSLVRWRLRVEWLETCLNQREPQM